VLLFVVVVVVVVEIMTFSLIPKTKYIANP